MSSDDLGAPPALIATYRLQLTPGAGFDDAAEVVGDLAALGISHVYTSPYLQAAAGSQHGYDVVDPGQVSAELGGPDGRERFLAALGLRGLGHVVDIVPNHMATDDPRNHWWWDVLRNGPASPHASAFDVDWDPPERKLRGQVLVPVLGEAYGRVLDAGELSVVRHEANVEVLYGDHRFPTAPPTLDGVLRDAAGRADSELLAFLADAFGDLPRAMERDPDRLERRHRDAQVLDDLLEVVLDNEPGALEAIDAVLADVTADHVRLHELLERQNYRLAHWRTAAEDLDYRRFFDVDTLVAVRVEDERVFRDVHELVLSWVADGSVQGIRVDHPDGLRDPSGYLARLASRAPGTWLVVEKILQPGEELLETWPVAGTTGYEFLRVAGGLYVDPAADVAMTELYRDFTGEPADFERVARDGKALVLERTLGSELNRLTDRFARLCEDHYRYRDHSRAELRHALEATVAAMGVYRTYGRASARPDVTVSPTDRAQIDRAIGEAMVDPRGLDPALLDFLGSVLRRQITGASAGELADRFEQLAGALMAKGVEDTAFYRYHRLICLNEVGGDPGRFGTGVDELHRHNARVQERWPTTMLATSTHDTKRSEDVRMRIAALSEVPEAWAAAVHRWARLADSHRGNGWPDPNVEYLLYQTLVGAHPLPVERAWPYLEKAAREAKQHTSWTDPDVGYESALRAFVEGVLADEAFQTDLARMVALVDGPARVSSLSLLLLKLTSPGVPDIYQGAEGWTDSLVDPDNRRPIGAVWRRSLLDGLTTMTATDALVHGMGDGRVKAWLTQRVLATRRRLLDRFGPGEAGRYEPLTTSGSAAAHVVAFCRGGDVITVVPRLVVTLSRADSWRDTTIELPGGRWRDELTGVELDGGVTSIAALLAGFPVALLSRVG